MFKSQDKTSLKLALYFIVPFIILLLIKYKLNKNTTAYLPQSNDTSHLGSAPSHMKLPETVDYIFHVKPILSDRCYLCHGPDEGTREAGLRLDTKEGAYAAIGEHLDRHAIVPGDVEASRLVFKINSQDPEKVMPPPSSNLSLSEYEKKILTKWIAQGAVWKDHWSFIPPIKKDIPKVSNTKWPSNSIDYFILSNLEEKGLVPTEKASKEKLIRKVYFDLTGLPPSITDIDAFISDPNEDAYEKVVDKLLASEAYGERMASNWLDVARYADTHGYQDDLERIMWPWRDWVIHAFNKNLPYDKFIKWQIAGDLLPKATLEQIVATGFNRNHKITQEGGVIDEEYRVEYVIDRTITTSTALLGLTMECARCHDHKYDPISQKEFYSMYGFFNKVKEKGRIEYDEIPEPNLLITDKEIEESLSFINKPDSIPDIKLMVMEDGATERQTFILNRGQYDAPTKEVSPGTPKAILSFPETLPKNRLGLAEWLFSEDHPLTARVAVNRIWQQIFGIGIVSTVDDFGNQGALPTHPELLDWLAVTFREKGWDIKQMIKMMVMSSTYQQSSKASPELLEIDPDNLLLARSSRSKLTAEMVRDNALAVSGLLVHKIGGPSVKPYQPEGLWAETTSGQGLTKYIMDAGESQYRRSLYTFWKRTVPPPAMITFDAATRDICSVKRQKTSTPLQALVMLNDPQLIEASEHLAKDMLSAESLNDEDRVKTIFRKITSRYPDEDETDKLMDYLESSKENFEITPENSKESDLNKSNKELYALTTLTSLIFNLDEAIVKG
ncbi:PSD1 and planctomycete cytochrome C domain-containing protein [Aestuariivivens sediminis]|uniref:PSD1 and planctomycete cytochrome C domain-containing protein n=1 Tax=Aestuariivivens sediminis TaxID=2913557 RepID=UPI001F564560|nr:PSD1 and planctomycete cytochrome C domain-containing protein [Aestuariivivens sediminis]